MFDSGYFDWAATSPIYPESLEKYIDVSAKFFYNSSSVYSKGLETNKLLNFSRLECAKLLGVSEENIFFTSGGTESNNIVISSFINRLSKGTILVSEIEHPSVLNPILELEKYGYKIEKLKPNKEGIITPETLAKKLKKDVKLIAIMLVNNETGAIQPIKELAEATHKYEKLIGKKIHFHCDIVQAVGKIEVNIKELNISSASISAHKFSGPKGIGILYLDKKLETIYKGGGQESGIRSGTQNLPAIVTMVQSLRIATSSIVPNQKIAKTIKKYLISKLKEIEGVKIISENSKNYSPYILTISPVGIPAEVTMRILDEKGLYVSNGSACSSNSKKKDNYVLKSMGISQDAIKSSIRISWGHSTTLKDAEKLIEELKKIVEENKFLLKEK